MSVCGSAFYLHLYVREGVRKTFTIVTNVVGRSELHIEQARSQGVAKKFTGGLKGALSAPVNFF